MAIKLKTENSVEKNPGGFFMYPARSVVLSRERQHGNCHLRAGCFILRRITMEKLIAVEVEDGRVLTCEGRGFFYRVLCFSAQCYFLN